MTPAQDYCKFSQCSVLNITGRARIKISYANYALIIVFWQKENQEFVGQGSIRMVSCMRLDMGG